MWPHLGLTGVRGWTTVLDLLVIRQWQRCFEAEVVRHILPQRYLWARAAQRAPNIGLASFLVELRAVSN